jgi:hypothetical protein
MRFLRVRNTAFGVLAALVAAACLMPDPAEARPRQRQVQKVQKWHGWTGKASTFYLDGVAYPGGSRRGPAMAYNNYEGGFHPVAFWVLHQRSF